MYKYDILKPISRKIQNQWKKEKSRKYHPKIFSNDDGQWFTCVTLVRRGAVRLTSINISESVRICIKVAPIGQLRCPAPGWISIMLCGLEHANASPASQGAPQRALAKLGWLWPHYTSLLLVRFASEGFAPTVHKDLSSADIFSQQSASRVICHRGNGPHVWVMDNNGHKINHHY